MSSSSSSEEDFLPVGIGMLKIDSKKPAVPVMVQKVQEDDSDLPSALRYYSLLTRAMDALNKNREDENERLKLKISVVRKSRRTYVNVVDLAHQLNRHSEHLAHFLSRVLLTDGSINKEGSLVLTGSFLQSAVEKALRQFIELYVVCKSCDSVDDTYIVRENKLYFLKCGRCKGSRCVGNTIEGFALNKENLSAKYRTGES